MVAEGRARDHRYINESTDPLTLLSEAADPGPEPGRPGPARGRLGPDGHRTPWHHTHLDVPVPVPSGQTWSHGRRHRHDGDGAVADPITTCADLRGLRRSSDGRVLAGLCSGLSQTTGIDVTILRIGFVLVGLAFGIPVLVYALAWLIVPMDEETTNIFSRAITDRRGIRLVIAVIPVVIVTQLVVSALHIGFVGIISWPVFLAAGLIILIWRNASETERVWMSKDLVPMLSLGSDGSGRWKLVLRVSAGVLIGAGGILVLILGPPEHRGAPSARRGPPGHRRHRGDLRPMVVEPRP